MTSKPPAKPGKPAIHAGDPQGTPFPRSLDRLKEANETIADLARQQNELAAHGNAGYYAGQAQQRVQAFRRSGYPELDEIPQPTGEKYRTQPLYRTSDGRSWMMVGKFIPTKGTTEGPIGRRGEVVTYVDLEIEGVKFTDVLEWNQVTVSELATMRDQAEKDEADHAEIEKADAELRKLIDKAITYQRLPQGPVYIGSRTPTLDEVEKLISETGAEVEVRHRKGGSEVLVVRATTEAALLEAATKLKSAPRFLAKRIRGFDLKVQLLVFLLEELKPLSTEWVKTGQRPKSETDPKQLANSLAGDGAWLP